MQGREYVAASVNYRLDCGHLDAPSPPQHVHARSDVICELPCTGMFLRLTIETDLRCRVLVKHVHFGGLGQ